MRVFICEYFLKIFNNYIALCGILVYIIDVINNDHGDKTINEGDLKMLAPRSIRNAETEETKAISKKAQDILFDKLISDEDADKAISEYNAKLTALGIPAGGLTISRAKAKANGFFDRFGA